MTTFPKSAGKSARRRAFTVLESLLAGALLTLLLIAALSLTSAGTLAFGNTAQSQYAELDVTRTMRRVESVLAEACDYTISSDGQTITYYNYQTGVYPPKKDTTVHTFSRSGTNLNWSDQPGRPLLQNVPTTAGGVTGGNTLILFGPAGGTAKTGNLVTLTLETVQDYASGTGKRQAKQRAMARVSLRNFSQTGTQ